MTDLLTILAQKKDSALPDGITQAEIDEYAEIHLAILKAEKIDKPLNDRIKAAYKDEGTYLAGNVVIERYSSKVFDPAEFAIAHPREQYPQYYAEVPATFVLNPVAIEAKLKADYQKITDKLQVSVIGG